MGQNLPSRAPSGGPVGQKSAWSELVISTAATSPATRRGMARGQLRRIAHRFYTSNLRDGLDAIVRRHYLEVAGAVFPGCVIADRSAAAGSMVIDGDLFIVYPKELRDLVLPGLRVRPRVGPGALTSDTKIGETGVYLASPARTVVENTLPSRARSGARRRLSPTELEEYLDRRLRVHGLSDLEGLADAIPVVSRELGLTERGDEALQLTREVLGTHKVPAATPVLRARQLGQPYDPDRVRLMSLLVHALQEKPPEPRPVLEGAQPELPFFEAYFSNYIEGTEFALDEARAIVESGIVPEARPDDGHDILGVYQVVADGAEMSRTPGSPEDLCDLLKARHQAILKGRPDRRPGMFKVERNRAGATMFVLPELVGGTLAEGFKVAEPLLDPFSRAVYLSTLISEVHPFNDGNGRLARVFMNAELAAHHEQRIIIPTAMRDNYLSALRALSHSDSPAAIVAILDFAQRFTRRVDWSSYRAAQQTLTLTHALLDSAEMEQRGVRLAMPDALGGERRIWGDSRREFTRH